MNIKQEKWKIFKRTPKKENLLMILQISPVMRKNNKNKKMMNKDSILIWISSMRKIFS